MATNGHFMHLGHQAAALRNVWTGTQLFACIGLPFLVLTFLLSSRAHRHATLVNLCLTYVFSGLFSLLLFFTGTNHGPEPPKSLCIVQTAFMDGLTPMWSVSVLMLMLYMRSCCDPESAKRSLTRVRLIAMLVAPYIAFMAFALAGLILSVEHPDLVSRRRRFFYCSIKHKAFSDAMQFFTVAICISVEIIEVMICVRLYRNWRAIRNAGQKGGMSLQLVVRVLIFGFYILLGMILDMVSAFQPFNVTPDVFAATIGPAVFFLFASQKDVLNAWAFWRWRRSSPSSVVDDKEVAAGRLSNTSQEKLFRESFASKQDLEHLPNPHPALPSPEVAHVNADKLP